MERALLLTARTLLILWAGFWTWFTIGDGLHHGASSLPYVGGGLLLLAALSITAWRYPGIGAGCLFVGALAAAWWFSGWPAFLLLTLPALVLAALFALHRLLEVNHAPA